MSAGKTVEQDLAPVHARPGPEVGDPVRGPHRHLVVLDDEERVAEVAERLQRGQEALVVARVEPDRRFVEDVEDPDEAGTDLRREGDPLRLPAAERRRGPVEGEVGQADVPEEPEPRADLLDDLADDLLVALGQVELVEERARSSRRSSRSPRRSSGPGP